MKPFEFLQEMLENYRKMMNFSMGNDSDPILTCRALFAEREAELIIPSGVKKYLTGVLEIEVDGVVLTEAKKVVGPEDDLDRVKDDLSQEMLTGVFSIGMQTLQEMKLNAHLRILMQNHGKEKMMN